MANEKMTLPALLETASIQKRFDETLKGEAASFKQTLISLYNNTKLGECDVKSILSAAMYAAGLRLPITPALGLANIVPYKGQAQFIIGYRGLIQLALRTNKYRTINVSAVHEGELRGQNIITGEFVAGEKISDNVVGYIAYIELLNGFKKAIYMSTKEIREHAKKYSQSYAYDLKTGRQSSVWTTSFDTMAKKTVLKKLLNTYAPISVGHEDITIALQADQSVIGEKTFTYPDNDGGSVEHEEFFTIDQPPAEEPATEIVNNETGEVVSDQQTLFAS